MFEFAFIRSRSVLVSFTFLAAFAPAVAAAEARLSESYGKLPLSFEANQRQTHQDVRFLSRGRGYSLYLTADEAVLVLTKPNPDEKRDARSLSERRDTQPQAKPAVLRMSLVGAARKPLVSGLDPLPGKANYFVGKDPAKWRTNVPTYAKVHYREVYPGIDLVYYGNQRQLEHDFVVAPGADPKRIVLGFKGANKIEIDTQGELVLHAARGDVRLRKPVIYQEIDGVRQEIAGRYVRKGANRIGFKLAAYDATRPLVIDPVLSYSTYLGGSQDDYGWGIAVDALGNAYATGIVSANFPTTPGAFQTECAGGGFSGCTSAFVTKLDPSGTVLYSTYLYYADAFGIAVDAIGNAYVTGRVNAFGAANFPTTSGAFQSSFAGGTCNSSGYFIPCRNAFVTKLDPTGSALVYSTFLGGSAIDDGRGITVDALGNAYVTGSAGSTDFPTTPGAFQTISGGNGDAFVTKLNPTGTALVYSTYLGGSGAEEGHGIAVEADGSAYVTGGRRSNVQGWTPSNDFPTTAAPFPSSSNGGACVGDPLYASFNAFVTKLNPTGSGLTYSVFLGGSDYDEGFGIAIDREGNAYVTGRTASNDFPTTAGAFQPTCRGGPGDVFVAKIVENTLPPLSSTTPTEQATTSRSEESAANYMGYWPTYGAETGTFSGGTIVASTQVAATATFSFMGTAVSWIGVKCNVCGIATVSIDGGVPAPVNTAGPGVPGSLTSEPVFSASGLAPGGTDTLVITVAGTTVSGI